MRFNDEFSKYYKSLLESEYSCVDRFVMNAYYPLGLSCGGFRIFWKNLFGEIENLDDAHLMRMAGRFSRRVYALCKFKKIPVINCMPGDKKYEMYKDYLPNAKNFTGLFVVFNSRAKSTLYKARRTKNGLISLEKKVNFVNHFSFHIIDKEFGHLIIKMCAHPPFGAQIILNGHEWVERQANKQGLEFTKESNCFTSCNNADQLCKIADTYAQATGHLQKVCDYWIYQCLWFGLSKKQQEKSEFKYRYSIFQCEYSQNFNFKVGNMLEQVYQNAIDLTRRSLDIPTLKKILGNKHRPFYQKHKKLEIKVSVEKPSYDVTICKIHFGKIGLKLYDKGERTLRAEITLFNAKCLRARRSLENMVQIVERLKEIMTNFLNSLKLAHISFLNDGSYTKLLEPIVKGKNKLAGININNQRIRAFMQSVLALALQPGGFTINDITNKMSEKLICSNHQYTSRNAWYDIKKFKFKNIIAKVEGKRKYRITEYGINLINSVLVLFENIIPQTIAGCTKNDLETDPIELNERDKHFKNINYEIKQLCSLYGIHFAA